MLKKNITELINSQINYELYSSYIYLGIHDFYASKNLNGFANWFMIQTQEERDHALLFIKYLQNNSEEIILEDVKKSPYVLGTLYDPLESTLAHEQIVTERINNIYDAAITIKDFRTTQFLDWFVKEQGEEEKNIEDIIKKFEMFGSDPRGLYLLDQELTARVYAPPTLVI